MLSSVPIGPPAARIMRVSSSLLRPRVREEYCDERVCLFATACLFASIIPGSTCPIFTALYLWPFLWSWFGPPLAALRYVMYFRFYWWRHICIADTPYGGMSMPFQRVTSLRRLVYADGPAASYLLHRIVDDDGRRDQTSPYKVCRAESAM